MYKRILVPLDGSERAEAVLPLAIALANESDAKIILLRVAEYPYAMYSRCVEFPPLDPVLAETIRSKKRTICCEIKGYLERIAANIETHGIKVVTEVCECPVVEAILSATDCLHIDAIVMSATGQGGRTSSGVGSVAERVLCEARVPVILVQDTPDSFIPSASFMQNVPLAV